MTLRTKIVLAQLPLVVALLASVVGGGLVARRLSRSAERILEDNYRSVLAIQRMEDSIERMDSAALFLVAGRREDGLAQSAVHRRKFDEELRVQEGNITESGEREATIALRRLWTEYQGKLEGLQTLRDEKTLRASYFGDALPAFLAVKRAADVILAMNQDAMVQKSERAKLLAARSESLLGAVSIGGLLLGLILSTTLTSRLLRPLSVLGQAARRVGAGDLDARARIEGRDEIAGLAGEFNAMAERIQKYRQSTLGELLEAQRASQATIDSLPDPVLVLSAEGHPRHVNRAAEQLLRISLESAAGETMARLDPAVRSVVERAHQHVVAGKGAYTPKGLEEAVRVSAPEGDRYLLPRAAPVYADEGNVAGTTIVLQDVSRLLRFEQLRNDLVATVAHELRTPLTSLRMAIHLLTEETVGALTEKQADLVYAAREDCARLQSTVDELLDLSRIQAGRIDLRKAPIEIESLVRSAIDAARAQAAQRRVELRAEVLPGSGRVLADVDRVQVVLANLLANAIRNGPEGGTVTVRAAQQEDGGARFEVEDRGPGIPKGSQQAVFEKYFQLPNHPPGGAGLGLFIAREIVLGHSGAIGVVSEEGAGSTFWFTLPAGKRPSRARDQARSGRDDRRR